MQPSASPEPRYDHLLEVLDGAAALHMAIRQAEEALLDPDLHGDDRSLLASALDASRERFERVVAILRRPEGEVVEALAPDDDDAGPPSERDLLEAGRAAEEGSDEAERFAARAIDRLGRSLDVETRGTVETFLGHASPLLRASALKVLALHWRLRDYTERALWFLASDDEPDCRRAAALSLGSLYRDTRDRAIGRELAAVVNRVEEEPDVRWASYHALADLDGGKNLARPLPIDDFDPKRLDAGLIARYSSA